LEHEYEGTHYGWQKLTVAEHRMSKHQTNVLSLTNLKRCDRPVLHYVPKALQSYEITFPEINPATGTDWIDRTYTGKRHLGCMFPANFWRPPPNRMSTKRPHLAKPLSPN